MTLPIALSVPHVGLEVPDRLAAHCRLTPDDIGADADREAAEVYDLEKHVAALVTTPIARAVLDMNRSCGDRRRDGVIKSHTSLGTPVWRDPLPDDLVEELLQEHDRYHLRLTALAQSVLLGIECHTMAAVGPPKSPDPGRPRPLVCLGEGDGACPRAWLEQLQTCFARHFPGDVTVNEPFAGGYITRIHGQEMPWLQLELSRAPVMTGAAKRRAVLAALTDWWREHTPHAARTERTR